MRKYLLRSFLTSAFLCFLIFSSSAQTQWGVKAGYNLATVTVNKINSAMGGPNAGLFFKIPVVKKFFILSEVIYSLKGNSVYLGLFYEEYLNAALLGGMNLNRRWAVLAGLEVGYLAKAGLSQSNDDMDATDQNKRWDLGAEIGLRYHFKGRWGADWRFIYGLVGIQRTYTVNGFTHPAPDPGHNPHNEVLQLGLSYRLSRQ